jgi:hypothetical protein
MSTLLQSLIINKNVIDLLKKPAKKQNKEKLKKAQKARKERLLQENLAQAKLIAKKKQENSKDTKIFPKDDFEESRHRSIHLEQLAIKNNRFDLLPAKVKRNAVQKVATPKWTDNSKVQKIYEKRDRLNQLIQDDPYEVDHHYPILGKTVCGLHTQANLVILKKSANRDKSNKHPDESVNHG